MSEVFRTARQAKLAAALLAAVLVILGYACGGDGNRGGGASGSPSPSATGEPRKTTIDLSQATDLTSYAAEDVADLVNVGVTIALGDFDDDGNTDALIGAPQADGPDNERQDAGEAYIVFGPLDNNTTLSPGSAGVTFFGAAAGDGLGSTVVAGDLNGDGMDDVIIGAPGVTAGFDPRSDQGRVYVFFGGGDLRDERERDLTEDIYDLTVTGAEGFSRLGHAIGLGDVNGDGTEDLVVGAPFAGRKAGTPPGGERTALGEVYVVYGSSSLSGERNVARDEFDVVISGGYAFGQFGSSLGVGDVDGDGLNDVVVGAYRAVADEQGTTSGVVYVFKGRSSLAQRLSVENGDQDATIVGPASSSFGFPVVVADLNGDRIADIAAGAQLQTAVQENTQGVVYVVPGSHEIQGKTETSALASLTITGSIAGELFPSALGAGDIDGDGTDDLIAGSTLAGTNERPGAGVVHVFTALDSAPPTIDLSKETASVTVLGVSADDRLGGSVAGGPLPKGVRGLVLLAAQAEVDSSDPNTGVVYVVPIRQ